MDIYLAGWLSPSAKLRINHMIPSNVTSWILFSQLHITIKRYEWNIKRVVFPLKFFSFCLMIAAVLIEIIYSRIKKTSQLNISFNSFFLFLSRYNHFLPRHHVFTFLFLISTFLFSLSYFLSAFSLRTSIFLLRTYVHILINLSFFTNLYICRFTPTLLSSLFFCLYIRLPILYLYPFILFLQQMSFSFLTFVSPFSTFIHLFFFFNKCLFLS